MNLTKNIVLYEVSYCMIKLKEKINYEDYYTIYSLISFQFPRQFCYNRTDPKFKPQSIFEAVLCSFNQTNFTAAQLLTIRCSIH